MEARPVPEDSGVTRAYDQPLSSELEWERGKDKEGLECLAGAQAPSCGCCGTLRHNPGDICWVEYGPVTDTLGSGGHSSSWSKPCGKRGDLLSGSSYL